MVDGFKTVLAYRTGLAADPDVDLVAVASSLDPQLRVRRRGKTMRDLLFRRMLGLAADLAPPVQVHSGYGYGDGDFDLWLAESNPLLLEEILRTPEGQAATVALIHGTFPWHEQAGYLASVKPNLYVELSLSPLLSPATTADRLLRLLDTAPAGRLLAGTDGHGQPETHWFAAHTLRNGIAQVHDILADAGARPTWLASTEQLLLKDNATGVYHLPGL